MSTESREVEESGQKRVTHVIFDMDGLLIDTEDIYTKILDEIAVQYGRRFTWDLKINMMGKKHDEAAKIFIDSLKLPISVAEYSSQLSELYNVHMVENRLLPGVEKLVKHLYSHNIPMAIATGSSDSAVKLKSTKHKHLFNLFHHIVCSSSDPEVERGKPYPDSFLVAARRFEGNPAPEEILVFEDAPNGVEAALAANMSVVWVPHPDDPTAKSITNLRPTLMLRSLTEFKPEMFGLPAYILAD